MTSIDILISSALELLGSPAVKYSKVKHDSLNIGNTPEGFDCSGFFQYILLKLNVNLYAEELGRDIRYSREFYDYFGIPVESGNHTCGDLVFFSYCGSMPTHMGLFIGENKIIHKGFIDTSLIPAKPTGDYPKSIIISDLDIIAKDIRNAGCPINYNPNNIRGPQKYTKNPIGFKRLI